MLYTHTLHDHLNLSQCECAVGLIKCVVRGTLVVCVCYQMDCSGCCACKAVCEHKVQQFNKVRSKILNLQSSILSSFTREQNGRKCMKNSEQTSVRVSARAQTILNIKLEEMSQNSPKTFEIKEGGRGVTSHPVSSTTHLWLCIPAFNDCPRSQFLYINIVGNLSRHFLLFSWHLFLFKVNPSKALSISPSCFIGIAIASVLGPLVTPILHVEKNIDNNFKVKLFIQPSLKS